MTHTKYINATAIRVCLKLNGKVFLNACLSKKKSIAFCIKKAHSILYPDIPFIILAITNFALIYHLRSTILIFTLLTMPATLVAAYYSELVTSYKGQVLLVAGDSCGFSYHALSIIILSVTNKRFFRKLKGIFYTKPEIHLNTIGLHDTTL